MAQWILRTVPADEAPHPEVAVNYIVNRLAVQLKLNTSKDAA